MPLPSTSRPKTVAIPTASSGNVTFAEWRVKMTFRKGIELGPYKLASSFELDICGTNKFEIDESSGKIRCLRVYHETSSAMQLAAKHTE